MHSGMAAIGHLKHQQYSFVVKPSPGSRKLDFIPYDLIPEITNIVFITNNNVLVRFKTGKIAHFMSNGMVIDLVDRIQEYFMYNNPRIKG